MPKIVITNGDASAISDLMTIMVPEFQLTQAIVSVMTYFGCGDALFEI